MMISCSSGSGSQSCKATRLIVNFPEWSHMDRLFNKPDTIYIFQLGSHKIYKLPKIQQVFIEDSLVSPRLAADYFAYREKDSTGILYRTLDNKAEHGLSLPVDSMLFNRGYKADFIRLMDSLQFSHSDTAGEELIEHYSSRNSNDSVNMFDSVFFYFDRRKSGISYSLDATLDRQKQSKLYKVIFWFKERYALGVAIFPKRTMEYEISCEEMPDKGEIDLLKKRLDDDKR